MIPPTAAGQQCSGPERSSDDYEDWLRAVQSNQVMTPPPRFSLAVSRALGTVVVTVHGILDSAGAAELEDILRDLITDQGNLSVVVDLRKLAVMDLACVTVFVSAWEWASRRGGKFSLYDPPPATTAAIRESGLPDLLDVGDVGAERSSVEASRADHEDCRTLGFVPRVQAFESRVSTPGEQW